MFQIDLKSRKAIYEQVIDNFKRLISTGVLKKDEKVPSVREMAKVLTINPNTIQKAYRELESQGYFYTVLGQGSFISSPPNYVNEGEIQAKYSSMKMLVHELMFLSETEKKILDFVKQECGTFTKND